MKDAIKNFLHSHFSSIDDCKPYSKELLDDFLTLGPLHYFIPESQGGRFDRCESYLDVVETTSYYSLPLGLTLGITGSLFLQPLAKHAMSTVAGPVLEEFLQSPALGGMMVTEPTGGTDIFGLNSSYERREDNLLLNGKKCWGGLTGMAEHWLVAARMKRGNKLSKRVNLIYVPLKTAGVQVETSFDALGLQPIPYGQTAYKETTVPASHLVLKKGQSGLRMIYDTLFRSRLGMPAIAAGLCKRLYEETSDRASQRKTFGQFLSNYDQVRFRLSSLRGMYHLNHLLWRFTAQWMNSHQDISGDYTLVNASKVVCSETMQRASDSALQVFASAAFKRNHLVGRAYTDSRPFLIFEGSNDVLHENTFEAIIAHHDACTTETVHKELAIYGLPLSADVPLVACDLFQKTSEPTQRQKVQLGRIIAWIFMLGILEVSSNPNEEARNDAKHLAQAAIASLAAEMEYL